jgi:hypothetical protein
MIHRSHDPSFSSMDATGAEKVPTTGSVPQIASLPLVSASDTKIGFACSHESSADVV